jgi:hypothetical protein
MFVRTIKINQKVKEYPGLEEGIRPFTAAMIQAKSQSPQQFGKTPLLQEYQLNQS